MRSRAIIILSLVALAILIGLGSVALYLSTASAATEDPSVLRSENVTGPENSAPASPAAGMLSPEERKSGGGSTGSKIDGANRVVDRRSQHPSARTLQQLLTRIHTSFATRSTDITDGMIPYLAEVITVVNQQDDLKYTVEIYENNASLARERAQTLNDVLRLNVLHPQNLKILGREGSRRVRVYVSP